MQLKADCVRCYDVHGFISIPRGAVKRIKERIMSASKSTISIPRGAVKSKHFRFIVPNGHKFQFQEVQLKESDMESYVGEYMNFNSKRCS